MEKDTIITQIKFASRELMRQFNLFNSKFSSIGSISQCHALVELATYKTMSMKQVTHLLGLEKSTVSRLIVQLVHRNLCEIQPSKVDRRSKLISLTAEGSALAKKIHAEYHVHIQQALTSINQEDLVTFAQGLSLYTESLQQLHLKEKCKIRKLVKKDVAQLQEKYKFTHIGQNVDANHSTVSFLTMKHKEIAKSLTIAKSGYFVYEHNKEIVGIAGYSPLPEANPDICIVRCFHAASHVRGLVFCEPFLQKMLGHAKSNGFKQCYSEFNKCPAFKELGFQKAETIPFRTQQNSICDWLVKEL